MSTNEEMQAKVDMMAQAFLAKLPLRFEKMNEVFALCHQDLLDLANWQELRRLIHSLGGAAGTFGFPAIGDEARALEVILDHRLLDNKWSKLDLELFGAALAQLQRPR